MNTSIRYGVLAVLSLALAMSMASCSDSADQSLPKDICGTYVDPDLARPLVASAKDLHEFNRVDRREAKSAPCVLLSERDPVLYFNFYWTVDSPGLERLTKGDDLALDIVEPRSVHSSDATVVGNNGAISTALCRTSGGQHFTLALKLSQASPTDRTHRKDIEKFMRAYFPATLETLGCK
jgi:hypothetical protein